MPARIRLTPEDRTEALERHRRGETLAAIAAAMGISRPIITRELREAGATIRKGPRPGSDWQRRLLADESLAPRIIAGYAAGRSRRALAVEHGTYPQRITQVLVAAGVEVRDDRTRRGEVNPIYKGQRQISSGGYAKVLLEPDSPFLTMAHKRSRTVLEHRLAMAEHLGRPLYPYERVHHINGDRLDNRIANLELWEESHPPGQRSGEGLAPHCPTCTCRSH